MLCVHRLRVLQNKYSESTLLSSNIRQILFEFRDLQYIQYNMELRYILMLAVDSKVLFKWLVSSSVDSKVYYSNGSLARQSIPKVYYSNGSLARQSIPKVYYSNGSLTRQSIPKVYYSKSSFARQSIPRYNIQTARELVSPFQGILFKWLNGSSARQ